MLTGSWLGRLLDTYLFIEMCLISELLLAATDHLFSLLCFIFWWKQRLRKVESCLHVFCKCSRWIPTMATWACYRREQLLAYRYISYCERRIWGWLFFLFMSAVSRLSFCVWYFSQRYPHTIPPETVIVQSLISRNQWLAVGRLYLLRMFYIDKDV